MSDDNMAQAIRKDLARVEAEEGVSILYACESGSRAWGFESADSDYDVRFIFLRPTATYLTISHKRDVIERPLRDGIDLAGWDLRKTLELFRRSNPPLLEWIQSPIVYTMRSSLSARLRALLPQYYSPVSCMHHYLHMAEGNMRQYLKGDEVWTKKYFYVLRPVLACLWIERGLGAVPMELRKLVDTLIDRTEMRTEVHLMEAAKKSVEELGRGPRNEIISAFVESEIQRLSAVRQPPSDTRDPGILDQLFVEILAEVYGNSIIQR